MNLIKKYFMAKKLRPYKTCALMMNLRGRAIRATPFEDGESHTYQAGDRIEIRTDGMEVPSRRGELQINLFDLPPIMRDGDTVLIGENETIQTTVKEVARTAFIVEV